MKLLHLLPSVDPRSGGPAEGVRQSGVRLNALGHHVEVVSLDDPAEPFVAAFELPVHALGPTRGSYRYSVRLCAWLREHVREFDAVIINGLWQYHGFGAWRVLHKLDVPYYVFVHGMLDPWFKKAYFVKHLKKWLYWPWADYRVLRDARAVLFTTDEERRLARQSFWLYRANEAVVSFGTASPPTDADGLRELFWSAYPALRTRRPLLFLGRIHEKKGCDLLIAAFARVAALDSRAHLVIAGPDSNDWRSALQALADTLGIGQRITWPGMLEGRMKWAAFYAADAFVLPSHQENFGIAVAEALGCGVPALISDKVNIWREVDGGGAGFVAADTVDGTEANLRRWLTLDEAARARMRARARACFDTRFTVEAMSADLLRVMQSA